VGTKWTWIFKRFWIFLFEVFQRSDFFDPYSFDPYLWLYDPPKW
jgi:hypothetical protein